MGGAKPVTHECGMLLTSAAAGLEDCQDAMLFLPRDCINPEIVSHGFTSNIQENYNSVQ